MKNVIRFLNVEKPHSMAQPGEIVVLTGEAPVWMYCGMTYKVIAEGAAVVAIAHGIDTKTNGGASIVAYTTDTDYVVGKTLNYTSDVFMEKWLADPKNLAEQQEAIVASKETIRKIWEEDARRKMAGL